MKKYIKTLIEIPAECKWKAQDVDGLWYAYTVKPLLNERLGIWYAPRFYYKNMKIGEGPPNPNWTDTLSRIYEYEEIE